MIESDERIYSRFLAERNEEDLRLLLERHREGLTLFLFSIVHSTEDAEELMLDAFAQAAAGAGFAGKSAFKTWLFSIGKKLALTKVRKKRLRPEATADRAEEGAEPPELALLRQERNRQLYRALGRLRAEYRQILILLYFEDMSREEAGRVMGKSRKQIYNLAERGRKALKEELERMGFDDARYG